MKQQLLLLLDVDGLGRKGEVVTAKPGFIRNFLLPQRFAVVATANTLRKQERLRQERAEQARVDSQESNALAQKLQDVNLQITVKVDPEGHMYGSVSALDIAQLLQEQGFVIERRYVQLVRPIKETGVHKISLKLKEGVLATCQITIAPDHAPAAAALAQAVTEGHSSSAE